MATYRLTLEYDGRDFEGWQSQLEGHRTVQGTLEATIERIAGERIPIVGAGRTDAGVHAQGQVASLRWQTRLEDWEIARAINALAPPDLVVREAVRVHDDFHALRDARGKHYRYQIWNGRTRSPLRERRYAGVPVPLEVDAMARAARAFEGTHDFKSLQAAGSSVQTTIRQIDRVALIGSSGSEIAIEVEGRGFLRHMVRNLAGTLIEVGLGKRSRDSMPALLAARDRSLAGPTAPAHGLTLLAVRYADPSANLGEKVENPTS